MARTIHVNRRSFLKASAAGAGVAGLGVGLGVWSEVPAAESKAANEKLNIGIIGVNHRGGSNMNNVRSENIAALCDIDERYLAKAKGRFSKAATFNDWRKLCERKDIDAVVVSTADHCHAVASVMAMKTGKHVYCEKPLAHTVHEARVVRETYKKSKVATQMGTQIHATENYRRVVELVQSGAIGKIHTAHVWCGRTSAKVGPLKAAPEIPKHLHWDLWLGPVKDRPYNPGYLPGNLTWNRWWDFGNGVLGDMGSHLIDLPYWALELKHPTAVEAEGPPVDDYSNPAWMIARWDHPATDKRAAVQLVWYHHNKRPKSPAGVDLSRWHSGVMFEGEKGQLVADYGKHLLLPKERFADFKPPKRTIARSLGHHREWIHACKTGAPTLCNFEYSGALIENNLLGNVAYRVGKKLKWDAEKLTSPGSDLAGRYVQKEYRKGWEI
jgi:predicted dehydrogenase